MAKDVKYVYEELEDGEWFHGKELHRLRCCDCGLIHIIKQKKVDGETWFSFSRDNKATASTKERRTKQLKKPKVKE